MDWVPSMRRYESLDRKFINWPVLDFPRAAWLNFKLYESESNEKSNFLFFNQWPISLSVTFLYSNTEHEILIFIAMRSHRKVYGLENRIFKRDTKRRPTITRTSFWFHESVGGAWRKSPSKSACARLHKMKKKIPNGSPFSICFQFNNYPYKETQM